MLLPQQLERSQHNKVFKKMSTLRVFIPLLFLVMEVVFSTTAINITSKSFNGTNCNLWPLIEHDLSMEVHLAVGSKVECASECVRKKCTSFQYLNQTSVCRISSFGISNETEGWYCSHVSNSENPTTVQDSCTLPFKNYHSICITHIEQKFFFYSDMVKTCIHIGGELYKINVIFPSKEIYLTLYSYENKLGNYGIQGQLGLTYGFPSFDWYNTDGSKATRNDNMLPHEILVVDHGILKTSGAPVSDVLGVICEQASKSD